jgi:gamma-glutamyltranspeptidase/glutathione hydrolase
MLNILEGYDVHALGQNTAEYLHLLVEAKKAAFVDRARHIADPAFYQAPVEQLLSKTHTEEMRQKIDLQRAAPDRMAGPRGGEDTVYLTVVDKDRNVVSLIQSIFSEFGSGLVAGDTGIVLHNRGAGFSFDPQNPNHLAVARDRSHTGARYGSARRPSLALVRVMGGDMQAQGHVQVLLNLIDFGMDVQQAGEQPRFRDTETGSASSRRLGRRSGPHSNERHRLIEVSRGSFGGYQGIMIDPQSGALAGGSDPRKDGCAIGW